MRAVEVVVPLVLGQHLAQVTLVIATRELPRVTSGRVYVLLHGFV
jgi:hypothetical protein